VIWLDTHVKIFYTVGVYKLNLYKNPSHVETETNPLNCLTPTELYAAAPKRKRKQRKEYTSDLK
jgi:hypothetical protein